MKAAPQRKLLLHFDTNKTILLADASKRFSKEILLMELCAGYSWGKLEGEGDEAVWRLSHPKFAAHQPGEGMMSYKQYLENIQYPDKTGEEEEANEEARIAFNKTQKEKRRQEMQSFIKPSGPGIKLKADFDKLNRDINLPKAAIEELGVKAGNQREDGNNSMNMDDDSKNEYAYNKDPFTEIFKDGKYNILPSFFKMMINLKKMKREFAIVFRSFDTELQNIIYEFNKFCEGNHPCFNGRHSFPLARFDGSKGSKNFIIDDKNTGVMYRESSNIEDTSLVTGTLSRLPNKDKTLETLYKEEVKNGSVKIFRESANVHLALTESLKDSCGFAIQDDFVFWNQNGCRLDCAKPLIVDSHDYNTLQIFFDDNVHDDETSIVDCRDLVNKTQIHPRDAINKYTVKVDTLAAINDQNYFFKVIEACEKVRQEEIDRIEHGVEEEIPEKSDWEVLQGLDDAEYLRRVILPLLYPAFQVVDMERPEDPLSFIAFYVLKNKHRLNLPQAPPLPEKEEETRPGGEEQNAEQPVA